MTVRLLTGDCRDVLATLPAEDFDACVCDPPYDLTAKSRNGSPRHNDYAGIAHHRIRGDAPLFAAVEVVP